VYPISLVSSEPPVGKHMNRRRESTKLMAARGVGLRALSKHISFALVEIVL
jgi:hypothetical protein